MSVIVKNIDNPLLDRKEVKVIFRDANGKLTKNGGAEQIVNELKVKPENVVPIYLKGNYGNRDLTGLFYIYNDINLAKKQLSKYIFIRMLPKDERKKLLDERKKKAAAVVKKAAK